MISIYSIRRRRVITVRTPPIKVLLQIWPTSCQTKGAWNLIAGSHVDVLFVKQWISVLRSFLFYCATAPHQELTVKLKLRLEQFFRCGQMRWLQIPFCSVYLNLTLAVLQFSED
ncbi:hypothetical protein LINPERPRIM_LOCUS4050 [Linum perenne]